MARKQEAHDVPMRVADEPGDLLPLALLHLAPTLLAVLALASLLDTLVDARVALLDGGDEELPAGLALALAGGDRDKVEVVEALGVGERRQGRHVHVVEVERRRREDRKERSRRREADNLALCAMDGSKEARSAISRYVDRREEAAPLPSLTLPPALPFMRSHIFIVRSLPSERASLPVGWTLTELTRPTWPLNERSTFQSRVRNRVTVESSEAVMRCVREGKWSEVMEPGLFSRARG
jgi:hypothetical protein